MKIKTCYFSYFFTVAIFSGLFLSCETKETTFSANQVFRYNEYANISSLDPAFAKDQRNIWATNQLFNGLVQLDDSLHVQPDIAKSWSISDDGLTYEFSLRKDVAFHRHKLFGTAQTRAVVADDFVYSFQRLLDPKVASPGGWVFQHVARFEAVNDSVLSIHLKQAFPPFLSLLAMKYCSVVSKEAVAYFGNDFRSNPIGTGPFYFKLWVENTKLVFRKNKNYHETDASGYQLPYLEAVAITFLPDKQSEYLQFIQGNLDFMKSLDASYKDDILTTAGLLQDKYKDRITLQKGPYLNTEYLGFYMGNIGVKSPVQSQKIRQAINYGFDRVKMLQFLRNGVGTPAIHGFIPKGLPSFSGQEGYTYQPEKARNLLEAYKEEIGEQQVSIAITTNSNYLDLCEYIQRELQKIGFTIHIEMIPPSSLRQGKAQGKFPVFRASWIADYPDAENYLSLFYSKNFTPNGPNYTHFKNTVFDSLYEEAIVTTVLAKRHVLYQKMNSIIIENAPIVPLYYDEVLRFSQKNITGMLINPIDLLQLKTVQKH